MDLRASLTMSSKATVTGSPTCLFSDLRDKSETHSDLAYSHS